jgi:hypothetical protein
LYKNLLILILSSVILSFGLVNEPNAMGRRPAPAPDPAPTTEVDPVFTAHPAKNITDGDITEWRYKSTLTEVDPTFANHPAKDITSEDIQNIRTGKTESDPVFDVSPARSISAEDVYNVKNMDTIIEGKISESGSSGTGETSAIPVLSASPENAKIGDKYINEASGVLCHYVGEKILDTYYQIWTANPTISYFTFRQPSVPVYGWDRYEIYCKPANTVGHKPIITFTGCGITIVDYNDLSVNTSAINEHYFKFYLEDIDDEMIQYSYSILKLSNDPEQVSSPWPLRGAINKNSALTFGFPAGNTIYDLTFQAYRTAQGEIKMQLPSGGRLELFNMEGLTAGIYGFVFEAIDKDHNRTISEVAPLKIRFVPEELTQ